MTHTTQRKLVSTLCLALLVALVGALPATAQVADVDLGSNAVYFQPTAQGAGFMLRVTGPNGYVSERAYKGANPSIELTGDMVDGTYNWDLTLMPRLSGSAQAAIERSRLTGDMSEIAALRGQGLIPESKNQSGVFTVAGGAIVSNLIEEKAMGREGDADVEGAEPLFGTKAQVIATDLIVDGSACIGVDCTSSESFGFDTLRLKENNLRIKFDDTSSSGSFPNNDWQLTANDSGNGGANKFSIEDITGGKTPFTLEAAAPSNSLYVDDAGNIGVGTSTPVVEVHVVDGDSPTLRLEQNGSSGFGAQTWDLAGNETNFFVRDVTNGSKLPFKIIPNSPVNSLYVHPDGIGLGTASPDAALDVTISSNAQVLIGENLEGATGDDPMIVMKNLVSGNNWSLTTQDGSFVFDDEDTTEAIEAQFNDSGRVRFRSVTGGVVVTTFDLLPTGNLTIAGTLTETSDINSKENFETVDPRTVLEKVAALPITTWNYRDDTAMQMGPMAQDFFATFGLGGTAQGLSPRNVASVALAAVQGLNAEVEAKDAEITQLNERLAALEAMVAAMAGAAE